MPLLLGLGVEPAVVSASCATMLFYTTLTALVSSYAFGALVEDYARPLGAHDRRLYLDRRFDLKQGETVLVCSAFESDQVPFVGHPERGAAHVRRGVRWRIEREA